MKSASWILFLCSVATILLGVVTRFTPTPMFGGVGAGTFWKAAMAFLGYAATLRLLTSDARVTRS